MEYNRSSKEIMKEVLYLLSEYNKVKEFEDKQQRDRLDAIDEQLHNQEDRIRQAAKILLGD